MGALVTKVLRPIKSYNIENRAHRVISKEKPDAAPKYPSTLEELKRVQEIDPDLDSKLDRKDPALDDRLKDVYVTSHGRPEDDITKEKRTKSLERLLPQNRGAIPDFDFGLMEPEKIPYGKTTLRHAIDYISSHQVNPTEITAAKIAYEYKLNLEDVENILKYFKTYEVYLPATKQSPATFAGPAKMREQLYKPNLQEIEVSVPRDNSIGAASLGARRDAPPEHRAPSVRSDERPLATQGDMLNSIKIQRRLRDSLNIERQGNKFKNSIPPKEKTFFNVNSKTNVMKPGLNYEQRDKPVNIKRGFQNKSRPSSPKGRQTPRPSFY